VIFSTDHVGALTPDDNAPTRTASAADISFEGRPSIYVSKVNSTERTSLAEITDKELLKSDEIAIIIWNFIRQTGSGYSVNQTCSYHHQSVTDEVHLFLFYSRIQQSISQFLVLLDITSLHMNFEAASHLWRLFPTYNRVTEQRTNLMQSCCCLVG